MAFCHSLHHASQALYFLAASPVTLLFHPHFFLFLFSRFHTLFRWSQSGCQLAFRRLFSCLSRSDFSASLFLQFHPTIFSSLLLFILSLFHFLNRRSTSLYKNSLSSFPPSRFVMVFRDAEFPWILTRKFFDAFYKFSDKLANLADQGFTCYRKSWRVITHSNFKKLAPRKRSSE